MRAVAVIPGRRGTAHITELAEPALEDVPEGRGVLVRILRVGLDGTDREVNAGDYGAAPEGSDVLVLGHESFGVVEQIGPTVTEFAPGDYVVARVRRGHIDGGTASPYDLLDSPDFTTDTSYFEHGISRVHGFLTERYVEHARYLVQIPPGLREVGVLLEPLSVAEKGIVEAFEIQRRLGFWQPRRAAVLGAGTIGLLAAMVLHNRGLQVTTYGLTPPPYLNSKLIEALGGRYVSTEQTSLADDVAAHGQHDLVLEATGYSPIVFDAMGHLVARNGILVLASVTGGLRHTDIPSDSINLDFVLGNKVMFGTVNAGRAHFEEGVRDMALIEARQPGWLARLLTNRVEGLDRYDEALGLLTNPDVIKAYVEIGR